MAPHIVTFGCRLNLVESEAVRGMLPGNTDTVVINTCAVTAEAERQARQAIRRLVRERPEAEIVVTGCAVQVDPARWAALPGVTRVLGNADKMQPASWSGSVGSQVSPNDAASPLPRLAGFVAHTRGFVQVQAGCDHRCTFCTIPLGRGPQPQRVTSRHRGTGERPSCGRGAGGGADWGWDIASHTDGIGALAAHVLRAVPDLARLRLSSLDPAALDDPLWAPPGR